MPDDSHITLKFPKVVPGAAESVPPSASGRAVPEDDRPSKPSFIPDWSADDSPTQRGAQVAPTPPAVAPSLVRPLLTVLGGLNAGQVFTFDGDEIVMGRGRDAAMRIDDAGVSRRHARVVRADRDRYLLEDLGSANGVFVNGRKVERSDLASGDRIQVGPSVVLRFSFIAPDEAALARKLYDDSTRDSLTRLYNRKYLGERLAAELAYAHRHGTLLSLILFDLDHFKRVNDTWGHLAGDAVLFAVAAQVQKVIRAEDVLARYGGEEFVVLARGIEHKSAGVLAHRIRKEVERLSIPWGAESLKMTVSIGVASLVECETRASVVALVALADGRLYEAKAGGRNRVC